MRTFRIVAVMWLAVPALAAVPTGVPEQHAVVLLDASASMTGFFTKDSICPLVDRMERALQQANFTVHGTGFKFASDGHDMSEGFSNCKTVIANGQITLIDRAYNAAIQPAHSSAPRPSTVWVITDNVQDSQGLSEENDAIQHFYGVLEQSAEEVHLFIRSPEFSGPLYGRDGKSVLKPLYQRPRGLLIYAILLDRSAKEPFENAIAAFENTKTLKDPGGIRVKGFSRIPVETELGKAGEGERIRMSPTASTILFDKVFSEHQRIKCAFQMNFRYGPDNLVIDQATVDAKVVESFQLFVGGTNFSAKEPQLRATPPLLTRRIVPRGAAGASNQAVQIIIDFPDGVEFPHSPRYLWSYLTQPRAALYKGKISVGLRAQKAKMNFAPELIQRYNAGDEYFRPGNPDQSRIFGLESLFRQLNSHSDEYVDIPAQVIPVQFSVSPPRWPLAALIAIAIAFVLLFLLLSRAVVGPEFQLETVGSKSYRLALRRRRNPQSPSRNDDFWGSKTNSGNNSQEDVKRLRLPMFSRHPIKESSTPLGELRRGLGEIQVRAATNYNVNGGPVSSMGRDGGAFSFTEAEAGSGNSAPAAEPRPRQARQSRASGSGSFFDN